VICHHPVRSEQRQTRHAHIYVSHEGACTATMSIATAGLCLTLCFCLCLWSQLQEGCPIRILSEPSEP
jgi:hypothetical protein